MLTNHRRGDPPLTARIPGQPHTNGTASKTTGVTTLSWASLSGLKAPGRSSMATFDAPRIRHGLASIRSSCMALVRIALSSA